MKYVADWVDLGNPEAYEITMVESDFEALKQKIIGLKKSHASQTKMKKLTSNKAKKEVLQTMELKTFEKKCQEKDKELEVLITKINLIRKGMRHNILLPMD